MKVVRSITEMRNLALTYRQAGKRIGFVPTMGALHEGHLSLLRIAQEQADISVLSIFVNPTQFGPKEDFSKYPRPFERDCALAQDAKCDILFAPTSEDMYPQGYATYIEIEGITERLCGASRPKHFRGVATVVLKFFNIVQPQIAVFGQKDAQQVVVLQRMVRDLHTAVNIVVAPIVRESDGLAMSSRNQYLTENERSEAVRLSQGLHKARNLFDQGVRGSAMLLDEIKTIYRQATMFTTEYIEIVDAVTLLPVQEIAGTTIIAVACRTKESNTRLIDNIVVGGTL